MAWVNYTDNEFERKQPLKYRSGDEKAHTVVIYASTVTLDDDGRRLVPAGSLLCEITSGTGDGKYGPYSKTASDGRENITKALTVFAVAGHDVLLGDKAIGGWFADCIFDLSELTLNGATGHSTGLTTLETAFPQCTFDD
jgi:hypothetical protein